MPLQTSEFHRPPVYRDDHPEGFTVSDEMRERDRKRRLLHSVQTLVDDSHRASIAAGWWTDMRTGQPLVVDIPQKLMLVVSELSEAMEGHRKGLMDDHLPDFRMFDAELADALIRILDLAGATRARLAEAYVAKRAYNDVRPDHKREARLAAGGKAY